MQALQDSKKLVKYDACVINGGQDEEFAEYMVARLEAIGLAIFYPPRDLRAGMLEHAKSEILTDRCKKVIAIMSTSLFRDNYWDLQLTFGNMVRNKKAELLLPVIYSDDEIQFPADFKHLEILHKLKYNPRSPLVNFWIKLLLSFGGHEKYNLTPELKRMDFQIG